MVLVLAPILNVYTIIRSISGNYTLFRSIWTVPLPYNCVMEKQLVHCEYFLSENVHKSRGRDTGRAPIEYLCLVEE